MTSGLGRDGRQGSLESWSTSGERMVRCKENRKA